MNIFFAFKSAPFSMKLHVEKVCVHKLQALKIRKVHSSTSK